MSTWFARFGVGVLIADAILGTASFAAWVCIAGFVCGVAYELGSGDHR